MQPQHKRLLGAAATGLAAAVAAHFLRRWRDRRRITRMTKVELHAHLNGSIRPATLRRLAAELTVRVTQALVSFAPLAFKLFFAASEFCATSI